jgi:hypothetical protein
MADTLRTLTDAELDREARLIERKVEALRSATSALGVLLLERYTARLLELRAEADRRLC